MDPARFLMGHDVDVVTPVTSTSTPTQGGNVTEPYANGVTPSELVARQAQVEREAGGRR